MQQFVFRNDHDCQLGFFLKNKMKQNNVQKQKEMFKR